ncbi:hypothetical protein ACIBL3_44670 [Kribbella sp. NPDC050124]|uniref:hypothetical protein n=1 Tax=Kribbella sp. NPDC050124 TaxID=3364114 RepID=UPI0037B4A58B
MPRRVLFGACRYATDQEVKAESAHVGAELGDCSVGGDKQVEHVEALRRGVGNQPGVRSSRGLHYLGGNRGVPWVTDHPGDTARSGGGGMVSSRCRVRPVSGPRRARTWTVRSPAMPSAVSRVERLAGQ